MSLGLWGKTLYSGNASKGEIQPTLAYEDPNVNLTSTFSSRRGGFACMAVNCNQRLVALVGQSGIDLIKPGVFEIELISTTKSSKRLIPTAAAWQGNNISWPVRENGPSNYTFNNSAVTGDSVSYPNKLVVADRDGSFRVYSLTSNDLIVTSSSTIVGRLIRSISFNTEQPNYLLTAVSDGSVRLWDLRQPLNRTQLTFSRPGDVTRDVSFKPQSETKFATIYDSGVVQQWDLRQRSSPDYRINAHQQGLCLDWHPRLNYLATGGRDHLVQIWNMNTEGATQSDLLGGGSSPDIVLQTPNSVQQVKWIDEFKNMTRSSSEQKNSDVTNSRAEILSSGIVTAGRPIEMNNTKHSYSCWSLEEPYMPVYTVESHNDAVTDIFVASSSYIWSCGLDGNFTKTDLRYETTVRELLPPAIVAFPPWDAAAVSFPITHETNTPFLPVNQMPHFQRRTSQVGQIPTIPDLVPAGRHPFSRTNSYSIQRVGSLTGLTNAKVGPSPVPGSTSVPVSAPCSLPGSAPKNTYTAGSVGGSQNNSQCCSTVGSVSPSTPLANMSSYFGDITCSTSDELSPSTPSKIVPKFIVEIGLPTEDGNLFRKAVSNMSFMRQAGETFAEVCRWNSSVMLEGSRFRSAEMWSLLAVAIDDLEKSFLTTLQSEDEIFLAKSWFSGLIDDNFDSRTFGVVNDNKTGDVPAVTTEDAVLLDDDDIAHDSEWLTPPLWSMDSYRGNETSESSKKLSRTNSQELSQIHDISNTSGGMTSLASSVFSSDSNIDSTTPFGNSNERTRADHLGRRSNLISKSSIEADKTTSRSETHHSNSLKVSLINTNLSENNQPLQILKEKFWKYTESQNRAWQFLPLAVSCVRTFTDFGYYTSAIALMLIFRSFPAIKTSTDISSMLEGGLLTLERYRCFITACIIRKSLRMCISNTIDSNVNIDYAGIMEEPDIVDTVCHRCNRNLSDNAAFYARNDQMVGYFYCSRCKLLLDGCCLCDAPIRGLCRAIIHCGHRLHIECWNSWVIDECMNECPSGCGQLITG